MAFHPTNPPKHQIPKKHTPKAESQQMKNKQGSKHGNHTEHPETVPSNPQQLQKVSAGQHFLR